MLTHGTELVLQLPGKKKRGRGRGVNDNRERLKHSTKLQICKSTAIFALLFITSRLQFY